MVSEKVKVESKALGEEKSYVWKNIRILEQKLFSEAYDKMEIKNCRML